jgi:hypothetical protein
MGTLSSCDCLPECRKEKELYRNFSSPGVGTKSSHRIMAFLEHLTGWEGWDIRAKTVHNTKNQLLFVWYQLTSKAMKIRNKPTSSSINFVQKKKDQNDPTSSYGTPEICERLVQHCGHPYFSNEIPQT